MFRGSVTQEFYSLEPRVYLVELCLRDTNAGGCYDQPHYVTQLTNGNPGFYRLPPPTRVCPWFIRAIDHAHIIIVGACVCEYFIDFLWTSRCIHKC